MDDFDPLVAGKTSAIVRTLREFGRSREVPVELVARKVGRTAEEIRDDLDYLKGKGVVELSQAGPDALVKLLRP